MAKKTTTSTTKPTTPSYGARGKADLSIVAAAGQRYAPITPDISGYMQALGDTAKVLIQRKENAIQRAQDVDLSKDIVGSVEFQENIEKSRDKALDLSKIMKNSLPFTKKHKDAKKEFEEIKKNIQGYNEQFKVIDQISTNLGGMVEDGKIQMSIGESEVKQNYYLALYTKDFGDGFDPDGDGPKKAVPFFTMEDGKTKMVNVNGDYVDPKLIKVEFKQAGDNTLAKAIGRLDEIVSNTKVTKESGRNFITKASGDGSISYIKKYAKDNPVEFTEYLMTADLKVKSLDKYVTFMDFYLENVLKDEGVNQDKLPQELLDQLLSFNIDKTTVTAKQMLFKSIKQYDTDFDKDIEEFFIDHYESMINIKE